MYSPKSAILVKIACFFEVYAKKVGSSDFFVAESSRLITYRFLKE